MIIKIKDTVHQIDCSDWRQQPPGQFFLNDEGLIFMVAADNSEGDKKHLIYWGDDPCVLNDDNDDYDEYYVEIDRLLSLEDLEFNG